MELRKLPIGIQNFERLRVNGYVYVDKTSYVSKLAREGNPYFLGRPRRFGKSLLLSTLKAYFEGKRELFEEIAGQPQLAIARLETEWKQYPVIYIDLNIGMYDTLEGLYSGLDDNLVDIEKVWGKDPQATTPERRLRGLIRRASEETGKKVVILVDEYDKPLTDSLTNPDLNQQFRTVLRAFYGIFKSTDEYLRFVFMTGVTRFSELSLFSGLNQVRDISMEQGYADICGMTAGELQTYFQPELQALAQGEKMNAEETWAELERCFNGYHFARDSEGVYNPFSLLNSFAKREFTYEWSRTGTPNFLFTIFENRELDMPDFSKDIILPAVAINDYRADGRDPVPLLYQTGYLTIKGYDPQLREYDLGFPNKEVRTEFLGALLPRYLDRSRARAGQPEADLGFHAQNFVRDLQARNVDGFMRRLQSLFALMSYELSDDTERHYQALFFMAFTLMGAFVQAEVRSAAGRADAVVSTKDTLYCFEFKLWGKQFANKKPRRKKKPEQEGEGEKDKKEEIPALTTKEVEAAVQEALAQIDDQGYLLPYSASGVSGAHGKKLFKVGAVFDAKTRTLGGWKVAEPDEK
jgi:hypothetical protein